MKSIDVLLHGAIDYAGLFPPASLDLSRALANYSSYRRDQYSWALGRFVLPLSQLSALASHSGSLAANNLSLISAPEQLNQLNAPLPHDCVLELKMKDAGQIVSLRNALPAQQLYIELSGARWNPELFAAVAGARAGAKLRTGAVTTDEVPAPREVIEFITGCKRAGIPWKATAGLHHPFRGVHPLSEDVSSTAILMHGFINLFLAATLIYSGGDQASAVDLLSEERPSGFAFDDDGVSWRSRRLTTGDIRSTREQFAVSFGSCSFLEPLSDLRDLHLL